MAADAASSPQPRKVKKKKKNTSFHPSTKRGPTAKPHGAGAGSSSGAGGGGRRGRPKPVHIDLDVVGTTHRAYSDAKDAVRNRKPPQKPPERKEAFDQEAWLKEQMAMTSDLNTRYNTKPPKEPKAEPGGYVPKPRKTQRAKQKPRQPRNPLAVHGTAAG